MASVARAIEQAAEQKVGADLWWDSFEALFQLLDKLGAAQGNDGEDKAAPSSIIALSEEQAKLLVRHPCMLI